jgi:ribosomal protein L11 methyltransferase
MDFVEISIHTTTAGIEPVTGRLYQEGITGVQIIDAADFNDFIETGSKYWDYIDDDVMKLADSETIVKAYISANEFGNEILLNIRRSMQELKATENEKEDESENEKENVRGFGTLKITLENISEEDWANNWKKYFKPFTIGEKILVKPEWEEYTEATDRIIFTINPGQLFGTGLHLSTQLCIRQLEKHVSLETALLLDLGCGSGILSIISMLLGAQSSVAVDIDANSIEVANENCELNGVDCSRYTVLAGDILLDEDLQNKVGFEKYDVAVANIVADVIIPLCPLVYKELKDDGIFISAGIIDSREEEVCDKIKEAGFEIVEITGEGDWVSVTARKV